MGDTTHISWADATFNPWIGCAKVSPGCTHCYAERDMDHRWGRARWGKGQRRVRTSDANWRKPRLWNRHALEQGVRLRVFCASLGDVFDPEVPINWLVDLLTLIDDTPALDWLLLTKRPHLVRETLFDASAGGIEDFRHMPNVWLGTTAEDQTRLELRVPHLLSIEARVRFLSCEPLLGPLDLAYALFNGADDLGALPGLHWVIAGGESGPRARPMHPAWARSLRDQCQAAGVPFHFKQWGEWLPDDQAHVLGDETQAAILTGTGPRSMGVYHPPRGPGQRAEVYRVGKRAAGRLLDGRTWDEVPHVG